MRAKIRKISHGKWIKGMGKRGGGGGGGIKDSNCIPH